MSENNHKDGVGCFSKEEFVAYLYDEIDGALRVDFDSHLAACSTCTDQFAGMSESRFAIYEWQREAFAPLATPQFDGPWRRSSPDPAFRKQAEANVSWLGGLWASILARPGFAVAASALLVAAIGFAAVLIRNQVNGGRSQIAATPETNSVLPAPIEPQSPVKAEIADKNSGDDVLPSKDVKTDRDVSIDKRSRAMPVLEIKHGQPRLHSERASAGSDQNLVRGNRRSPRLGDFDEDEDNTIRLSDLFAETGADKTLERRDK